MLFQVLCGFEPIFYTTHPNEEPIKAIKKMKQTDNFKFDEANVMNELVYRNLSEDENDKYVHGNMAENTICIIFLLMKKCKFDR